MPSRRMDAEHRVPTAWNLRVGTRFRVSAGLQIPAKTVGTRCCASAGSTIFSRRSKRICHARVSTLSPFSRICTDWNSGTKHLCNSALRKTSVDINDFSGDCAPHCWCARSAMPLDSPDKAGIWCEGSAGSLGKRGRAVAASRLCTCWLTRTAMRPSDLS